MIFEDLLVDEFTTPCAEFLYVNSSIEEVESFFKENKVRHIPVLEGDHIIGIISERDFFKYVSSRSSEIQDATASDVMTENPYVVYETEKLATVAFRMSQNKIGSAIVLDSNDEFNGIFTTTDALNALVEILRSEKDLLYKENLLAEIV